MLGGCGRVQLGHDGRDAAADDADEEEDLDDEQGAVDRGEGDERGDQLSRRDAGRDRGGGEQVDPRRRRSGSARPRTAAAPSR